MVVFEKPPKNYFFCRMSAAGISEFWAQAAKAGFGEGSPTSFPLTNRKIADFGTVVPAIPAYLENFLSLPSTTLWKMQPQKFVSLFCYY